MRVFIAWSGQESLRAAEILQRWIHDVLQIRTWLSTTSIPRGGRWFLTVNEGLEDTTFGIACVSRKNIDAPWINFEMGAVAKRLRGTSVVPFVLDDLDLDEAHSPLAQFQGVHRDDREVFELLRSIRDACDLACDDEELRRRHDAHWEALDAALDAVVVQRHVGQVVDGGVIRAFLERDDAGVCHLVVDSASEKPVYILRWVLPDDRGDWDIPPSEMTVDGNAAAYPVAVLRPRQRVRVPATCRAHIELPLHIRFEWYDAPDSGRLRQMECWIEA